MVDIERERVEFDNGWSLSIIWGGSTYSDSNTVEVAVINPQGELDYTHTDGDVLGWQSPDDVIDITEKIKALDK